jgi:hypothetical protein
MNNNLNILFEWAGVATDIHKCIISSSFALTTQYPSPEAQNSRVSSTQRNGKIWAERMQNWLTWERCLMGNANWLDDTEYWW